MSSEKLKGDPGHTAQARQRNLPRPRALLLGVAVPLSRYPKSRGAAGPWGSFPAPRCGCGSLAGSGWIVPDSERQRCRSSQAAAMRLILCPR